MSNERAGSRTRFDATTLEGLRNQLNAAFQGLLSGASQNNGIRFDLQGSIPTAAPQDAGSPNLIMVAQSSVNSLYYWDGDSWVQIPTSSGGAGATLVRGTITQAINGSSLVDVTGLGFSALASKDYLVEVFVLYQSSLASVGLSLALTCPASPTEITYIGEIPNLTDATSAMHHGWGSSSADAITAGNVPAASVTHMAKLTAIVRNGVNAGTIKVQAANETATNNISIQPGSILRYQQTN